MNRRTFNNWFRKVNPYIAKGDSALIQRILNGDVRWLVQAFPWPHTPQGASHWGEVRNGKRKLSKKSRRFLTLLAEKAKEAGR